MRPRYFRLAAVLFGILALAVADAAGRAPRKSDSVVKVAARADKPDAAGNQLVTLTLTIDKPYHLYANPVGHDMLESSQTTVTLAGGAKPEEVKIEYPAGKLTKDASGDYKVYESEVTIKAHVRRAGGDAGPLQFAIRVSACDDSTCLQPATVKVTVP